ncbi:vomeronasal type-2 receptor 26-like [Protopterus annectens]|uniref:vomeronasal type-2 receptor 26-like n=1 Tax=Protopterus annectens TaxID=7888 RepID=UPI001CFA3B41|nr:vomeronasal type-2 receptor 26-like [Protopterus annectens]
MTLMQTLMLESSEIIWTPELSDTSNNHENPSCQSVKEATSESEREQPIDMESCKKVSATKVMKDACVKTKKERSIVTNTITEEREPEKHPRIFSLLHYLRNVRFINKAGEEIFFDVNGDPPAVYDLIAWFLSVSGESKYVHVGKYDSAAPSGQNLVIREEALMWKDQVPVSICSESCHLGHRKVFQYGQPPCCFDCIPCSQGEIANISDAHDCIKCPDDSWSNKGQNECIKKFIEFLSYQDFLGAILTTITSVTVLLPASILIIFVRYRHTPIVKANNRELSYILLIALILCSLCSLIFIGKPTVLMCMLRQTVFGIMFALCVSCVLAKTITVVIAFKATNPNSKLRKWMGPVLPGCIICFCTMIQVTLCVVWLSTAPPFPEENMKFKLDTIIIECNDGSSNALWWLLGYMGLLASISLVVAFLARTLPDSFNEAKFITFSMLVFVSVWLSFIPAYLSTRGKYMVAVEIFAILSSSSGLVICIFIPKCYIILVRSEMNTREYLKCKINAFKQKTEKRFQSYIT